jgi:poly(3-hydroxybutyrate) depolymerase
MGLLHGNVCWPGSRLSGQRRGSLQSLAGVAVAATLVTGCAAIRHAAAAQPVPAGGTQAVVPGGSGCGYTAVPGSAMYSLRSGGHTREVIVHVPAHYSGTVKVPLVLNLHGGESTAQPQEVFSGMDVASDASGFIVA